MKKQVDDPLIHYGVLGMKWGRRKDGKPQGFQYGKAGGASKTSRDARRKWRKQKTKAVPSQEHTRSRELLTKSLSEMSNKEIREFNDRVRLEQEYARLKALGKSKTLSTVQRLAGRTLPLLFKVKGDSLSEVYREHGADKAADFIDKFGTEVVQIISAELMAGSGKKKK